MSSLTRRSALKLGAGTTLALVAVDDGMATPAEADAEIAKFTGAKAAESGKIASIFPRSPRTATPCRSPSRSTAR